MSFTEEEIAYLRSQPLGRLATVSPDGQPDAVPVALEFDGTCFWVGGNGPSFLRTRKVRNIGAGNLKVALVVPVASGRARSVACVTPRGWFAL